MKKLFPTAVIGSMPRPNYVQDLINLQLSKDADGAEYKRKIDSAIRFIIHLKR